jgi:hypothetical protein
VKLDLFLGISPSGAEIAIPNRGEWHGTSSR